jgi:hypothetical protein
VAPTITRTPIIDDNGTLTTGTPIDNAFKQELYDQIDALSVALAGGSAVVQTTTATGTQDDFALTAGVSLLRVNNASLVTFRGFSAGYDGQLVTVVSLGAGEVDFSHENAGSAAANRLHNFVTSGVTPLAPGVGTAMFQYDATSARWRLVQHEQGDWILRAYAGGNYTGNASMTWTVDSGDVFNDSFYLKGRTLLFDFDLATTTVGGTPSTDLQITLPNGYTSSSTGSVKVTRAACVRVIDNNGTPAAGQAYINSTVVAVRQMGGASWSASTNLTYVQGQISMQLT